MFGIFYALFGLIVRGAAKIDTVINDIESKHDTFNKNTGLYYDSKMRLHDTTLNDCYVTIGRDYDAKYVGQSRVYVKDMYGQKILRDLTQEKMDQEYAYLQAHPKSGTTVVRWSVYADENHKWNDSQKYPKGARYKDLKTGNLYVARQFDYSSSKIASKNTKYPKSAFYMDISNGQLVRVADHVYDKRRELLLKSCLYSNEEIERDIQEQIEIDNEWIKSFNERQSEKLKKGVDKLDPYSFYCNVRNVLV